MVRYHFTRYYTTDIALLLVINDPSDFDDGKISFFTRYYTTDINY